MVFNQILTSSGPYNLKRITKADNDFANKLHFGDTEFPVIVKDIQY